jgi:hypothetical protein
MADGWERSKVAAVAGVEHAAPRWIHAGIAGPPSGVSQGTSPGRGECTGGSLWSTGDRGASGI